MSTLATPIGGAPAEADTFPRSRAISAELRRVARRARIPRPTHSGGGGFRARRSDRLYRNFFIYSFAGLFVFPAIVSALYYSLIAADQYVSEARFAVRSGSESGLASLSGIASVLNIGQSSDGQIIAEYVKSRSIVEELGRTLDLRHMFNPGTWDVVAEIPVDSTIEKFVKYWRKQVSVVVDRNNGLITLSVRSFSPEDSLALAREIVRISEGMVNQLTRRTEVNSLRDAKSELTLANKKLEAAVTAMRDARISAGILDVSLTASTYSELLTALRVELSKIETQINALKANDVSNAPNLVALEAEAKALRDQIASYDSQMAGQPTGEHNDPNLAVRASSLAAKEVELNIAQNEYKQAVAAYEATRLESERQRSYLLTYVQPNLPEEALYPRRALMWAAIASGSFLVWALVAGLAMLVRDNTAA